MYRSCISGLLAGIVGLIGVPQALGAQLCRPALAINDVKFSKMQKPTLERKWTALVTIDASRCPANSAGYFEIVFSRLKEIGMEVEFRQEFMWLVFEWSPPSVKVEVDFWADEAVERYWFGDITPCPCRG